jgi:hypothetical protein
MQNISISNLTLTLMKSTHQKHHILSVDGFLYIFYSIYNRIINEKLVY